MTGYLFGEPPPRPVKPKPLTEAVRAILVRGGYLDELTGATRNARRGRCPDCRRAIWRGLNADTMAIAIDADAGPLGPLGEAMARLGGWTTVTLRFRYAGYLIDIRDQFAIKGEPPGSRKNCDVLTVHRCGMDTSGIPLGPSRIDVPPPAGQLPIDPPF